MVPFWRGWFLFLQSICMSQINIGVVAEKGNSGDFPWILMHLISMHSSKKKKKKREKCLRCSWLIAKEDYSAGALLSHHIFSQHNLTVYFLNLPLGLRVYSVGVRSTSRDKHWTNKYIGANRHMLYKVCGRTSRDDRISFGTGQEPASCDLCATLNPLHMTLQTVNFQRCEHAFRHTSGVSDMPACPPSPAADGPSTLPSSPPRSLLHHERFWPVHSVPAPSASPWVPAVVL